MSYVAVRTLITPPRSALYLLHLNLPSLPGCAVSTVTGSGAYRYARERLDQLNDVAAFFETSPANALSKAEQLEAELKQSRQDLEKLRIEAANQAFKQKLDDVREIAGVPVLRAVIANADADALRSLADQFRQNTPSGVVVLGTVMNENRC